MNIAMFTNTYLPFVGGVEQSIATFVEEFKNRGHNCLIVTPEMDGAEESTDDILRIPALTRFGGSSFSMHLPVPGVIGPRLDEFRPDIVHSHHPFLLGDAALRSARKRDVPLILTYHTLWERYADYFGTETIKNIVIQLTIEYSNICDHVIAPSESIRQFLIARGVEADISVIPTGIDTAFFAGGDRQRGRQMLGLGDEAKVIGYVGRVGPEKNLAWLADAAALWCRHEPLGRLLIVGGGDYGNELKRIFSAAGLEEQLVLAGIRKGQDLVDAYAAMDFFSFTSLSETQGIVLAEAMAAGLPIIGIDASGVREAVTDGENGRLLPGRCDHAGFAEAIAMAFRQSNLASEWRKAARERAETYSVEFTTESMLDLYESVIEMHRCERADEGRFNAFDALLGRLEAEWELIETKISAAVSGVAAKKAARKRATIESRA